MMKKILPILTLASFGLFSHSANAQLFNIEATGYYTCTLGGVVDCGSVYQQAIDDALISLEESANAAAGTGDLDADEYFGGLANGTAMAGSGLGAIYGSEFSYFSVGVSGGVGGILADGASLVDVFQGDISGNVVGAGGAVALQFGANAGLLFKSPWFWGLVDPTRLKGYLGVFFFPISLDNPKFSGEAKITSISAIGQYQLVPSVSLAYGAVKWNGLNISSGLRYNSYSIQADISQTQTESMDLDISGTAVPTTVSVPIDVGLDVSSSNVTLPMEASTSVRLGYFLTLLGGTAFDINLGSASGDVTASDSTVTIEHESTAGVAFTGTPTTADATVDETYDGKGKPTFLNWRAFVGVGIDFSVGNLTATLQKSILKSQWGANVALNFFY